MSRTIKTYTGQKVDLFDLKLEQINIQDIAQSLARICRFNGHIKADHYSVAEHCYHVSYLVPESCALEGLLHDAAEAYIGDMVSPLKHSNEMTSYRILEQDIEEKLARKFHLTFPFDPAVKDADNYIFDLEKDIVRDGMNPYAYHTLIRIKCWDSQTALKVFLDRFYSLYSQRIAMVTL